MKPIENTKQKNLKSSEFALGHQGRLNTVILARVLIAELFKLYSEAKCRSKIL